LIEWIGISLGSWLAFFHILLFVFWLGADLGVFYSAKYVARSDLSKAERLRFLDLLMRLDMYPRSTLILMLPVGASLAQANGWGQVSTAVMVEIWGAALAWFVLMWASHKRPQDTWLKTLDLGLRYGVIGVLTVVAAFSFYQGTWTDQAWLSIKLLLFAGVIGLGLLLRGSVTLWMRGFALLDSDADAANQLIQQGHTSAQRFAHTLWLLLILMALLGVAKPFA